MHSSNLSLRNFLFHVFLQIFTHVFCTTLNSCYITIAIIYHFTFLRENKILSANSKSKRNPIRLNAVNLQDIMYVRWIKSQKKKIPQIKQTRLKSPFQIKSTWISRQRVGHAINPPWEISRSRIDEEEQKKLKNEAKSWRK